jgi:LmbE family N-acetylglucosaminyl deacetylase
MAERMNLTPKEPHWLSAFSRPRALLVVAHPDDETIFAGGLILCSRNTCWTVVCCTNENSGPRRCEFLHACDFLARHSGNTVQPIPLELATQNDGCLKDKTLVDALMPYATGYDIVFTHNSQGEYGHERHKLVHRCVIESIKHENTWVFISPGSKNVDQDELRSKLQNGNVSVDLSSKILRLKLRAFEECHVSQSKEYGYDPVSGALRDTHLRETLLWYFEGPRKEEYSFYR